MLSRDDCQRLAKHFRLFSEQEDAITNSKSSSKDLLAVLEERGVIHAADVNRLLEALSVLKINQAIVMVESYKETRGQCPVILCNIIVL